MEQQDDKIIRDKLNTLDTLDAGYEPNLESKWSVLEAGLKKEEKGRRIVLLHRIAIAAAILILGTGAWLLLKVNSVNNEENKFAVRQTIIKDPKKPAAQDPVKVETALAVNKLTKQIRPEKTRIKSMVPDQIPTPIAAQPDTFHANENIVIENQIAIAETKPKTTKQRYVELDFNEPAISKNLPSEPVMAAQQFKFRIGFHSLVSSENIPENSGLKLTKNISN